MGTKALVARECNGGYDLYRFQYDGFALESRVGQLASSATDCEDVPVQDTDCDDLPVPGRDWTLVRRGVSERGLRDELNPGLDEALYVIDRDGTVRSYAVIALSIDPTARPEQAPGVLAQSGDDGIAGLVRRVEGARAALLALESDHCGDDQASLDGRLDGAFERAIEEWATRTIRLDAVADGNL